MKHLSKNPASALRVPAVSRPKLTVLSGLIALATCHAHAALNTGTVLTMTGGACVTAWLFTGVPPAGLGSCFGMEVNTGSSIVTNISSYNGIIIGAKQNTRIWSASAGGLVASSHSGFPNGNEQLAVDNAWDFFTNTGLHQFITEPTVTTADAALSFTGWNVSWNAIPLINMGGGTQIASCKTGTCTYNNGTGVASLTCSPTPCADESTYTLSYTAVVPRLDPSGFGGVTYNLRSEGTVKVPGALSQSGATSISVGSCATTVSSSDGRLSETNLTTCSIALDSDSASVNFNTRLFYDFTVNIGSSPGGNARVVIPLSAKLPSDAIFRIYKTASSSWATFATDGTNNIVSSAAGSLDSCPAAGDASYVSPPTKGHYCLQLTIQDNGSNDNNASSGGIAVRGGVASGTVTVVPIDTRQASTSGGGGCSLQPEPAALTERGDWAMVTMFIAWLGAMVYRRRQRSAV